MSTAPKHRVEKIAEVRPEWGHLGVLNPSADNRHCYMVFKTGQVVETPIGGWEMLRVVKDGEVVGETKDACDDPTWALSPGGKLAISQPIRRDGRIINEIYVDGELRWTMPYDTIYHMCWIDDERLVWKAWNQDNDEPESFRMGDPVEGEDPAFPVIEDTPRKRIDIFVNGTNEGHGITHFTRVAVAGRLWATEVAENGKIYTVFDDGTCSEKRDIDPDSSEGTPRPVGFRYANDPGVQYDRVTSEEDDDEMVRACYRNFVSEARFEDIGARYAHDGVEAIDSQACWAAYVGKRRVGLLAAMMDRFGRHMELREKRALAKTMCKNAEAILAESGELLSQKASEVREAVAVLRGAAKRKDVKGMEAGYRRLSNAVREIDSEASWRIYSSEKEKKDDSILRRPLMFAFALLANPYFGPLHIAHESSVRYFPAVIGEGVDRVWKKGYRWVKAVRLLPDGSVAVAAPDAGGMRVTINEIEGPAFDWIENLRVGLDGILTYCAVKGEDVYRVTVQ